MNVNTVAVTLSGTAPFAPFPVTSHPQHPPAAPLPTTTHTWLPW